MHSNHTLKSENPFTPLCMRKLVGQPLHPDGQDEANHGALSDTLGSKRGLITHPGQHNTQVSEILQHDHVQKYTFKKYISCKHHFRCLDGSLEQVNKTLEVSFDTFKLEYFLLYIFFWWSRRRSWGPWF